MKKFLFLLFFILLINNVSAYNIPQSDINKTIPSWYSSSNVSSVYTLSSNDVLKSYYITVQNNVYPNVQIYSFIDSYNNIVTVTYTYSKTIDYFILQKITRKTEVFLNGKIFPLIVDNKIVYNNTDTSSFVSISDNNEVNNYILFSGNVINLNAGFNMFSLTSGKNAQIKFINPFFPQTINNPISNQNFVLKSVDLSYQYLVNAVLSSKIDSEYDKLNFIFKFIFLILSGIVGLIGIGGVLINHTDILNFQLQLLIPITILDLLLKTFINLLVFISTMGLLWFVLISESLIFIFSYLRSNKGDLLQTFEIFIEKSVSYWQIILIKPLTWIFEKIVKIWS